jgi:hypothetical protein
MHDGFGEGVNGHNERRDAIYDTSRGMKWPAPASQDGPHIEYAAAAASQTRTAITRSRHARRHAAVSAILFISLMAISSKMQSLKNPLMVLS